MKTSIIRRVAVVAGLFVCTIVWNIGHAESKPDDAVALEGVSNARVIFDITQGNPKRLLGRLKLIEKTAQMMTEQGVKPEFVLAFRGPASFYASRDREMIPLENHDLADEIAAQISKMDAYSGLKFEQCSVATHFLKIKNKSIYPEIKVVGNSWISLAAYQNRGYAYIPID